MLHVFFLPFNPLSSYICSGYTPATIRRINHAEGFAGVLVGTAAFFAPVQRPFDSWKSYGGGVDSSQYSSLKQINKTNVKQLQVAWTFPIGGNAMTNPLVVDGVMYVPRAGQNAAIVALDAATGKEL